MAVNSFNVATLAAISCVGQGVARNASAAAQIDRCENLLGPVIAFTRRISLAKLRSCTRSVERSGGVLSVTRTKHVRFGTLAAAGRQTAYVEAAFDTIVLFVQQSASSRVVLEASRAASRPLLGCCRGGSAQQRKVCAAQTTSFT